VLDISVRISINDDYAFMKWINYPSVDVKGVVLNPNFRPISFELNKK